MNVNEKKREEQLKFKRENYESATKRKMNVANSESIFDQNEYDIQILR